MADQVTVRTGDDTSDPRFLPHPEMQVVAACVDAIDMGERVEQFEGNPEKLSPKVVLVYRTGEKNPVTGDLIDVSVELTKSLHEKARLRRHLESWRGKPYAEEELATKGVELHKLVGVPALISVAHKTSGKGRPYAIISSISPVFKGLTVPAFPTYVRAAYWEERKAEYAAGAAEFRKRIGAPASKSTDGEDPIPF